MCYIIFGTISHPQERMTVNHDATGSSPVTGASEKPLTIRFKGFFLLLKNRLKHCLWDRKFLREMAFKWVIRWTHKGFLFGLYMQNGSRLCGYSTLYLNYF